MAKQKKQAAHASHTYLHKKMDELQHCKFVGGAIHAHAKIETGVAAIDDFVVVEVDKVGPAARPRHNGFVNLHGQLVLFVGIKVLIPAGRRTS